MNAVEFENLVRKEFSHLNTMYFNSAYFGASPYRIKQKVANAVFKELDPSFYDYNTWFGVSDRIRRQLGNLIGADENNITFTSSVSDTNNIIANGYPFKSGDVICTLDKEYPSNIIPYMVQEKHQDIKLHLLEADDYHPDVIKKKIPKETKIFVMSHVAFNTGRRADIVSIGKFLRSRGILFVVDATQSLGGVSLTKEELDHVDIYACSLYKWMLGPYGMSFAHFSPQAQEIIQHKKGNWITSPNSKDVSNLLQYTAEPLQGARKYDRGQTPNFLAMAAVEGALEVLTELGLDAIKTHNQQVRDHFLANFPRNKYELVTPTDHMANIVCIKSRNLDTNELERELKHNQIDVSNREGNLRLSFHLYNNVEQVNVLLETLDL